MNMNYFYCFMNVENTNFLNMEQIMESTYHVLAFYFLEKIGKSLTVRYNVLKSQCRTPFVQSVLSCGEG